jgi:hypothetical protein
MEFLGRKSITSVSVGTHEVELDAFAAAAAAALAGRDSEILVLGNEPPLTLTLSSTDGASLVARPSEGGEAITLRDSAFGVVAHDADARRAAFANERLQSDVGETAWRAITDPLVFDQNPASRLLAIYEHRQLALPRRYEAMRARWSTERRISDEDLQSPRVQVLLSHLRIESASASLPDWERAAQALIAEYGIGTAVERLAAVPIPLPESLIAALSELSPESRCTLLRRVFRRPCSPVAGVNMLRLLARLGETESRYIRWAVRMLRHMGTENWQSQARLLCEVVGAVLPTRHPREAGSNTPAGSDFAGELFSAWYHAHNFVSTAAAVGGDAEALFERVKRHSERADSPFVAPDAWRDVAHPRSISYERLLVAGLQHAVLGTHLAERTFALKEAIRSTRVGSETEGRAPAPELLAGQRDYTNLLGTWLPLARSDDGAVAVGEIVVVPAAFAPDVVITEAMDALAADPFSAVGWGALTLAAGTDPLSDSVSERLAQIATELDIPTLLRHLGDMARLATLRLARQSLGPKDEARRQRLRESLLAAVRDDREGSQNASPPRPGDDLSHLQSAVLEGLYVLAGAEKEPAEAMRAFASDLSALGRTDAAYLRYFRGLVEELVRTRPLVEAHALTAVLGESRAT